MNKLFLFFLLLLDINYLYCDDKLNDVITESFCKYVEIENDGSYKIEISNEESVTKNGSLIIGLKFQLKINGLIEPKYTLGIIGIGNSSDDAYKNAIYDWFGYFAGTFKKKLKKSKDCIEIDNLIYYYSPAGIRGDKPDSEVLNDKERILFYNTILKKIMDRKNDNINTVLINIFVKKSDIDGECRINGEISQELTNLMKESIFFTKNNIKSYLLKEYFIIEKK